MSNVLFSYDAWMNMHPEAARQFEQKRQNTIWLYKQDLMRSQDMSLSEDERSTAKANADIQYSQLTDSNGGLLTPENYARSIANPMFKVMEFSKTSDTSEGGSTLLNENYLRNKTVADVYSLTFSEADVYSLGDPMEREAVLKNAATNRNNVDSSGKRAIGILGDSFERTSWKAPWTSIKK